MTLETPRVLNKCNHQLSFLYPLNSQTIVDYVCSKTQHFHICFENSFQSTCGYCHRLKYIIPITGDIHIIITQFMFSFAKSWSKKRSLISVSLVTWTSSNVIYWAKATEIKAVIWSTLYLKSLPKRKTHHCGGKKKKKKTAIEKTWLPCWYTIQFPESEGHIWSCLDVSMGQALKGRALFLSVWLGVLSVEDHQQGEWWQPFVELNLTDIKCVWWHRETESHNGFIFGEIRK